MATVSALCAASESALAVGDGRRAAELIETALAEARSATERTEALRLLARVAALTGNRSDALARLQAEAPALAGPAPALAAELLVEAVVLLLYDKHPDALAVARRACELAAGTEPIVAAEAEVCLGLAHVFAGDPDAARPYLARSSQLVRLGGPPHRVVHLLQHVVVGLSGIERYAESMALCRQYVAAVRNIGADGLLPLTLCLLSNTAYFTSEFDVMEMSATEALTLAESQGQRPMTIFARICLGLVLAVRGEYAAAREHAEWARAHAGPAGMHSFTGTAEIALAMAAVSVHDWPVAEAGYARVREFITATSDVSGVLHWRADEVETLWCAGRIEDARHAYREFTGTLPGKGPWERATAARVGALLADDPGEAERLFAEALDHHRRCPSHFERARTQLRFGEWLADRGRHTDAGAQLTSARDTFAALGARPWVARTSALLLAGPAGRVTGEQPKPASAGTAIRAFGPLTLVRDGVETPVPMDASGRMLRYLVAAGGRVRTEQLCGALWPDAAPEAAGTRLRTVLFRTRARYGPLVVRDGAVMRWADGVTVDTQRFAELAHAALSRPRDPEAAALAREAVTLYSADLVPLDPYTDWVIAARERMRDRYLALLDLLVAEATDRDDLNAAINYAREIVATAPRDDDAYIRLARLQLEAGRIAQARETITRARLVATELDLPVSPELVALEQRSGARDV